MSNVIMRGTTPTVEIEIDTEDFLLSTVSTIEWYVRSGDKLTLYVNDDLMIDEDENTVSKFFSADETDALDPMIPCIMQMRFHFPDKSVVGTEKMIFAVLDREGE